MNAITAAGARRAQGAPGPGSPAQGFAPRLSAFARLAKFEFVLDYYLSVLVVVSALIAGPGLGGDGLLTLGLFLLGEIGVVSAVMAFDDVNGFQDGSDAANYLSKDGTELRPLQRKPLLTGALRLRQAQWFGYLALAWGVALWSAAALTAAEQPVWALVLTGLVLLSSWQYSWGLRLSYKGLGELLIAGCPMVIVIAPYGLVAGDLPALLLVEGVLFGLWQILVSAYSNTKDIEGDAAVGRSTVAVRASARGNRLFIGVLSAVDVALTALAAAVGWGPWWLVLVMLPLTALRVRQYMSFLRNGDALLARRRGVLAFRTGVACLILVNLIH
ncbi:UbiA family prenyltransferase [Streptomyces sp. 796.1]|uniref:UbiA family prenyltransferase n=1 Tax=Streptomyces sp. 796.1 TaxID=3163029 RepID=UPI0039C9303A